MTRETLLLLPGHLCNATLWRHQIDALSETVECVVPDYSPGDSIEAFAQAILRSAPATFSLAAFSMGGFVAAEILRAQPWRVSRLALIGTRPDVDAKERIRQREDDMALVAEKGFEALLALLPGRWLSPGCRSESAFEETLIRMARAVGEDSFFRQQRALIGRRDGHYPLNRVTCPTLIMAGELDTPNPPEKQRMLQTLIPHARYVCVNHAGHLLPLEAPLEVTSALADWLAW